MTHTAKAYTSEHHERPIRLRGIIFDLDGVLANTEPLHFRAYHEVFRELGYQFTKQDHTQHWVRDGGSIVSFLQLRSLSFDADFIRRRKDNLFIALVRANNIAVAGCNDTLRTLSNYYKMSVCTSSNRVATDAILGKIQATSFFDAVVTSNDVERRKPTPDSYLMAARSLSLKSLECIVVEDAKKGVLAALAAGIPCVTIGQVAGIPVPIASVESIAHINRSFLEDAHLNQLTGGTAP